jgi:hypothetical protein
MLITGAALVIDNARQHTEARNRILLEHINWGLFDHPLYGSDLTPSDYHLLTYLKNWM